MNKATLLAEVIAHVKMLKTQAIESTKGLLVPTYIDEIIVVPYYEDPIKDGCWMFRASICCQYKPKLIPNIRQAINNLKLTIIKAEISTLEGRMKIILVNASSEEDIYYENQDFFAKSIHEALCSVLKKTSEADEFSQIAAMRKKRKFSNFEPSTTSN